MLCSCVWYQFWKSPCEDVSAIDLIEWPCVARLYKVLQAGGIYHTEDGIVSDEFGEISHLHPQMGTYRFKGSLYDVVPASLRSAIWRIASWSIFMRFPPHRRVCGPSIPDD